MRTSSELTGKPRRSSAYSYDKRREEFIRPGTIPVPTITAGELPTCFGKIPTYFGLAEGVPSEGVPKNSASIKGVWLRRGESNPRFKNPSLEP